MLSHNPKCYCVALYTNNVRNKYIFLIETTEFTVTITTFKIVIRYEKIL